MQQGYAGGEAAGRREHDSTGKGAGLLLDNASRQGIDDVGS